MDNPEIYLLIFQTDFLADCKFVFEALDLWEMDAGEVLAKNEMSIVYVLAAYH